MRIAIFSDVHGNLLALECFIKITKLEVDSYLCLGDVVNYGPWNDECLELVLSLPGIVLIQGNHERLFLGLETIRNELPIVQEFYESSIKYFSRIDLIMNLPICYEIDAFMGTHTINHQKIYVDTDIEVTHNYVIGHTHHQFKKEQKGKIIVNCGSIGQNRSNREVLHYVLYDTELKQMILCAHPYPLNRFINELVSRDYSQKCINYYLEKKKIG